MDQRALKKLVEPFTKTVTCFKKFEIECLIQLFYSLAGCPVGKVNTGLDRNAFRGVLQNIFGMTNDVLMNRVFFVFDKDGDSYVNLQEWIKGLAVFLRGTFEQKMRCKKGYWLGAVTIKPVLVCFEVYYLSGDAYISREKIFDMLKSSLFQNSPEEENEEGIKDLVEISLKKMDYDNDGKISFADFEKAVRKDGLLLEAFGPCLPDAKTCSHFEALIFKNNSPDTF